MTKNQKQISADIEDSKKRLDQNGWSEGVYFAIAQGTDDLTDTLGNTLTMQLGNLEGVRDSVVESLAHHSDAMIDAITAKNEAI